MRKQLFNLIKNTILYKYNLPNNEKGIERTIFSNKDDNCYSTASTDGLVELIYNSVIEYSFNEFEVDAQDYSDLQIRAFQERIRFDKDDENETQMKYGFFGEVVLYAILKIIFGANSIISKGYFYSPTENSESKGYDAYHLIESDSKIQLWFGETKFHKDYSSAVNDVLSKIKNSLSDKYLSKNLLALRKNRERFNIKGSTLESILNDWEKNPEIVITDELKKHHIELVYPIIILYQQKKSGYDESIKAIPEYIKKHYKAEKIKLSIPYILHFVLIPVEDVKAVKTEVLLWIKQKKPLLS